MATAATRTNDIWSDVLASVAHKSEKNRTVLLLGDRQSGKSSLRDRMQGISSDHALNPGVGLEYDFLDIRDPQNPTGDVISRVDVWTVNGGQKYLSLLKTILTESSFYVETDDGMQPACTAIVTIDLSQPWNIKKALSNWLGELQTQVTEIMQANEPAFYNLHASLRDYCVEFRKTNGFQNASDSTSLELEPPTLSINFGIPIVIVGTKADMLPKQDSDLLQQTLRLEAIKYGAAIVFTSAEKWEESVDGVMHYLGHRLYHFDSNLVAETVKYQNLYVPAGWDSESKIKGVYNGTKQFEAAFPYTEPAPIKEDIKGELPIPHQDFLRGMRAKSERRAEDNSMNKSTEQQFFEGKKTVPQVAMPFFERIRNKASDTAPKPDFSALMMMSRQNKKK
eukprot:c22478_g1_i1.p1 GENE.c22478_g1_i1~~c22478_g1_i1.p1  ORF type:complete len:394 (-),score=68.40 c22478_g1_i1:40-1221(-)